MSQVILPDLPHCRVLGLTEMQLSTAWCRRECDPFWRLYNNREAGASIITGKETIELEAEMCYLVPAWVSFSGRCRKPLLHRYVHFQVLGLPDPWLRRVAVRPMAIPGLRWPTGISAERSPAARLKLHALLCQALSLALTDLSLPSPGQRAETVVNPALRLIDARLSRPPSVTELAAVCGVTRDHLTRCFAAVVGRTPARWIQERRIAAAAELLSREGESVTSVADTFGYANPFHFSRAFRRITGVPPKEWRQRMEGA